MSSPITPFSRNPNNTYLDFCRAELDPSIENAYSNEASRLANSALFEAVIVPLFCAASFIASAVYAPFFTFLTGFSSILCLSNVKKKYCELIAKSQLAQERSNQLKAIHLHHENLHPAAAQDVQQILKQKGVNFTINRRENDPRLLELKPAIARHNFWEDQIQAIETKQHKKLKKANKLTDRVKKYELQSQALELENQVLMAKVKCAFINFILHRPDHKSSLEDLGSFSNFSGQERAIAMQSKDPSAQKFFIFKGKNAVISYHEAKHYKIGQLAMLLYGKIV